MSNINPYSCSKPGNLFVGYERLRRHLLNGFREGNSFAIIGGRRCGKTSLLIQIKNDLKINGIAPFKPISLYLDIQGIGKPTPYLLFEKIYNLLVLGVEAKLWKTGKPDMEYQVFLDHIKTAKPLLDKRYGKDWLAILLVDELDAAISGMSDDQFFQNLRNLLMMSDFNRHFRLVATGVNEMANLISSGSSPLNNLRNKYLSILTGKQARQVIKFGFPDELDPDIESSIFQITGKHPYLLQGLLEKLWPGKTELVKKSVKVTANEFLKEHHDFHRWLAAFGAAEHAVYQILTNSPEGKLHVEKIRQVVDPSLVSEIDNALTVLSYHGVIDDSDPDEPEMTGTLFRDWYQNNKPTIQTEADAETCKQPERKEVTDQVSQSSNSIVVNPVFNVSGVSISIGLTGEEIIKIFQDIKNDITNLPINERTKMKVQHALEEGLIEIKEPESEGEPNKEVVKSSLEKATGILKSAGCTVGSVNSFISKAEKLAPYLGKAVGWLAALI